MSPPEVWGPPIWTLFHVLAEKINERAYPFYVGQLFSVIKNICSSLPCPECTQDATIFLGKIKLQDLKTKTDFKNMIYLFHNHVNVKKRKRLYNYSNLEIYKKYNIIKVFNSFISIYHTRGNMNLLAESFRRQLIVKNVKNWFSRNFRIFAPSQPINNNPRPILETSVLDENIVIVENTTIISEEPTAITTEEPTAITIEEPDDVTIEEPTVESTAITSEEPTVESDDVTSEELFTVESAITSEEPTVESDITSEEPTVESDDVTSEVPEVLEPIEQQDIITAEEPIVVVEPQKTKKSRKKKTA